MKMQFQVSRWMAHPTSAAVRAWVNWLWCVSIAPLFSLALICSVGHVWGAAAVTSVDWGDAPAPYPTTQKGGGARHTILPGFSLGTSVDGETDGLPSVNADGDDLNPAGTDDENGVVFPLLVPGQLASVSIVVADASVTVSPKRVDLFIDFNGNGSWLDAGEHFVLASPIVGENKLTLPVPSSARIGFTYARVRLSRAGTDLPTGASANGEVEDYRVEIAEYDFGDAPEIGGLIPLGYPTTLARNGARHRIVPGFYLGSGVDREPDGQPEANALGDDKNPSTLDDEDGVVWPAELTAGQTVKIAVIASQSGKLDAWIDYNRNQSWADNGENVFSSYALNAGANTLVFAVPENASPGDTFARIRFSSRGGLGFVGSAPDGEVEDYKVVISPRLLDFGDAPEVLGVGDALQTGYPTKLASDGARHEIVAGFHLGAAIDGEADGQPEASALGDDTAPGGAADDEDGVRFLGPVVPGQTVQIEVTSAAQGRLDGWIDFNGNRSWNEVGEKVFDAMALVVGVNQLAIPVPANAQAGVTFARFRFSRAGGLSPTGAGGPGEVEDYKVTIEPPPSNGCNGGCGGNDFWLTFPGNYAPDPSNPVEPTLLIVGTPGTTGNISIAGLPPIPGFVIPASGSVKVILPEQADLGDANDLGADNGIRNLGVHLTTDGGALVNVYGLSRVHQTSDGFLALPTESLGTSYYIQSYANVHTGVPPLNGSQFAVVATAPGTTQVSITPSAVTGAHDSDVPYLISLMQGETYQLRNTYGAPSDLSGTSLESDKPVAVYGGHRCANVQSVDSFYCDYLVEQLLPTQRWGTEYYIHPLKTRSGGDTVRVMAAMDGTVVQINGVPVATLDHGKVYQTLLSTPSVILANQRIHVTQYANSSDHDLVEKSDPFMVQIQHKGQFTTSYKFAVAQDDFNDDFLDDFASNYVNVIAPTSTANANAVLLDGVPIAAASFTPIGATGYSGASAPVPIFNLVHTVSAPQPVGVIAYGWALYDSYAWPACFGFGDVKPPQLQCPPGKSVTLGLVAVPPPDPCKASLPDFRNEVLVTDLCDHSSEFVVSQEPPPGTLLGPGVHQILLAAKDASGNVGTCSTTFTVVDPEATSIPRFTEYPTGMTTRCTSSAGAIVNYTVVALAGCTPVDVECQPPSGSLFPIGTTHVVCRIKQNVEVVQEFDVTVNCDRIGIGRAGGQVSLNWQSGGVLQVSSQPTGPWVDAPTPVDGQAEVLAKDQQRFYRIRK